MNLVTRRHLLRAAAVTAPLVATLPSGAAMANASSFQCAVVDQQKSPPATTSTMNEDTFVRVEGVTWDQSIGDQTVTLYNFKPFAQTVAVTVDGAGNREDGSGNEYPQIAPQPPQQSASLIFLLVLYKPINGEAINGLYLDETATPFPTPTQCTVKDNLSGWPTPVPNGSEGSYCIYPIAELGAPLGSNDNMGITGSCLTSFADKITGNP